MASSLKRPSFLNLVLQLLLILSIVGFLMSTTWIFISGDPCGVYVYGATAIFCLLNTVGLILIYRWYKAGVLLCLLASLGESSVLFMFGETLLLPSTSTESIDYFPFLIIICVFIIIAVPLLVLRAQPSSKIIWHEMKGGMDIKHTRHIYQLTSILLVGVIAVMLFYRSSDSAIDVPDSYISDTSDVETIQRMVDYNLLDSANVTLDEIVEIESMIDSMPVESQSKYNKRIFALKHILLSGLMTDKHNVLSLRNIYMIHQGDFSEDQQGILDWFLSLPQEQQEVWSDCPSVDNLSDFEKQVKLRITN